MWGAESGTLSGEGEGRACFPCSGLCVEPETPAEGAHRGSDWARLGGAGGKGHCLCQMRSPAGYGCRGGRPRSLQNLISCSKRGSLAVPV